MSIKSYNFTVEPEDVADGSVLMQFSLDAPLGYVGRVLNVFGRATLDPEDENSSNVVHNMALAHDLPVVGLIEAWGVAPDTGEDLSYTPGAAGFPGAPKQTVSGDLRNAVFDSGTPMVFYYGVGEVGPALVEPAKFSIVVEYVSGARACA